MIVEYTRYKIDESRGKIFEKSYQQAVGILATSMHCLAYELSRCAEDETHYVLRIEWDSQEGQMKGFRASSEFKAFFELVRPFLNDIEEMRHYNVLSSESKTGA